MRIRIDYAPAPGALPRMLGLIERRGFDLVALSTGDAAPGEASLSLDLAPRDSGRSAAVIAAQLRRLHEVRSVSFPIPAAGIAP